MSYEPSSILLTDRVAIVTGAGAGIGRATAGLFARFGASLALCDREPDGLAAAEADVAATGQPVLTQLLDVRDHDAVAAFLSAVGTRFGRVDILVNNAGGTFHSPFADLSGKGEAALVAENFGQVTNLVRGTVPLMTNGGSIINLTSSEAHQAAPGFAVYAAMKAAVASLTRSLALELAEQGIRVNAIAPDGMPTEGDRQIREQMLSSTARYDPVVVPPLGYLATGEEAAAAAAFLASDLSRFITGTTLHVDGGIWAAGGWRLAGQADH
ncbi:MAG TPA: SDR family oxidoreductase [Acidimicrobiales bacterium]|nr:SDR family oxidoreductase [Acidimicrobiales bacterium]